MTREPNAVALGRVAAEHLAPILYALEVCAVSMDHAERADEAKYYRGLASLIADAGGSEEGEGD